MGCRKWVHVHRNRPYHWLVEGGTKQGPEAIVIYYLHLRGRETLPLRRRRPTGRWPEVLADGGTWL